MKSEDLESSEIMSKNIEKKIINSYINKNKNKIVRIAVKDKRFF